MYFGDGIEKVYYNDGEEWILGFWDNEMGESECYLLRCSGFGGV